MEGKKSGKYVFKLRELSGMNQAEFSKKLELGRSYISQLENERVDISLSTFIEWCDLFQISPLEIFDKNENPMEKIDDVTKLIP